MCEVLDRVEKKGFEEGEKKGFEKGERKGFEKGERKGFEKGERKGFEKGERDTFALVEYLISRNRLEDIQKAASDENYRKKLLAEIIRFEK